MKEIARKYRSEVARTKKSIEEQRRKTGEDGDQLKEREAEIKHHLDQYHVAKKMIGGEGLGFHAGHGLTDISLKYLAERVFV